MHIAAGAMADLCGGVHAVYLVFIRQPNACFFYISASRGGTLRLYKVHVPPAGRAHSQSHSRGPQRTGTSHRTPLSARHAGQPLTATSEAAPHRRRRAAPSIPHASRRVIGPLLPGGGANLRYGVPYSIGCFRPSVFSAYDTWF